MTSYKHSNVVELRGQPRETREQVLERLFNEHESHLRAFLKARMGSSDDLEDILQDVFIRVAKMENLQERLPVSGDSNRSFLFAVANNLVVDMERQRQVRRKYIQQHKAQVDEDAVLYVVSKNFPVTKSLLPLPLWINHWWQGRCPFHASLPVIDVGSTNR